MDVRDCMNHPFRIECPAELIHEPDIWYFCFKNNTSVFCEDLLDGTWRVTAINPAGKAYELEAAMTDNDSAITNFIDRIARLENP